MALIIVKNNMKKIIKRIGDSIGIIINRDESKIYDLKVNDVVEVTIIKTKQKIKKDGKK